jgi:hypothetical protein
MFIRPRRSRASVAVIVASAPVIISAKGRLYVGAALVVPRLLENRRTKISINIDRDIRAAGGSSAQPEHEPGQGPSKRKDFLLVLHGCSFGPPMGSANSTTPIASPSGSAMMAICILALMSLGATRIFPPRLPASATVS